MDLMLLPEVMGKGDLSPQHPTELDAECYYCVVFDDVIDYCRDYSQLSGWPLKQ